MEEFRSRALDFLTAHEPLVAAALIVAMIWLASRRIALHLSLVVGQLDTISRTLTSTELGQERVENLLSEIARQNRDRDASLARSERRPLEF